MKNKETGLMFGSIIVFLTISLGTLFYADATDVRIGKKVCGAMEPVRIHGRLLCVDPKTRVVHIPE